MINFGYLDCPSCKQEIALNEPVEGLSELLDKNLEYKQKIQLMAIEKAIDNGLDQTGRVVTEGDYYFGKLDEFSMKNCTFYECNKCDQPFFGGMKDCEEALNLEEKLTKENLLCKSCAAKEYGLGEIDCPEHGNAYIDFKC